MPETIKVTIAPDGSLSYEVRGLKGKGCKDLTKAIDALGTVTETKLTEEYAACPLPNQQKTGR